MIIKEYKLVAEDNQYLTQSKDVEDINRSFTKLVLIGLGSKDDWRDATAEEKAECEARAKKAREEALKQLGF